MATSQSSIDDYLLHQQKKLEDEGRRVIKDLNETNTSLLNQLFVAAGGLIALSSPLLLTESHSLSGLPLLVRLLLVTTLFMSALSLAFGVAQLYTDIRFFSSISERLSGIVLAIAQKEVNTYNEFNLLMK